MSSIASFDDFLNSLTASLDIDTKLRVYHVSTPPVPTTPIFAAPPGQPEEPTTCESHFLTISQPHVITSATSDLPPTNKTEPGNTASHVLILGIEVLVFSTESSTTVFVSKADSTGFLRSKQGSPSVVKTVISAFLKWLVAWQLSSPTSAPADLTAGVTGVNGHEKSSSDRSGQVGNRKRSRRLILSLFARAQNQYLFPGSIENVTKHVLDDRQLIKWWCRLLDELVQTRDWSTTAATDVAKLRRDTNDPSENATKTSLIGVKPSTHAYVVVPGCDRTDTIRSFFPPSARYTQPGVTATWHNSYPVDSLVSQEGSSSLRGTIPVRCLIPRLPDDPKARYCSDLDNAGIDDNGQWRDIRTLQQFWETMEYRQECAAGRLVGFIWVVFEKDHGLQSVAERIERPAGLAADTIPSDTVVVAGDSGSTVETFGGATLQSGSTVVTSEEYIILSDLLTYDTDFAGADLAIKSTRRWIEEVKELSGLQWFGIDVRGTKVKHATTISNATNVHNAVSLASGVKHPRDEGAAVNVLTGIRKKKQKTVETTTGIDGNGNQPQEDGEHTNGIAPGDRTEKISDRVDIRPDDSTNSNGIRTLSAGLVRKKQKPKPEPEHGS